MTRRALVAAQVAVTAGLLWLVFRGFDWPAFAALFGRIPVWLYLASLAVMLCAQVLYAWRWHNVMAVLGVTMPFPAVLAQFFIGTFVNNFLPSTVGGDVAKVYYVGRQHGYRLIAASVVLDRFLGLAILAALTAVLLWFSPLTSPAFAALGTALGALSVAMFVVLGAAVTSTGVLADYLVRCGARGSAIAEGLRHHRAQLAAGIWPMLLLKVVAVAGCYFVLITSIYAELIQVENGHHPGYLALATAIAVTAALSNIPVSLNGIGLREQLHITLLAPLGVSREVAVGIALLLFSHLLLASLLGGILWLRQSPAPTAGTEPAAT